MGGTSQLFPQPMEQKMRRPPLFQGIKIYYQNRATDHFHGSQTSPPKGTPLSFGHEKIIPFNSSFIIVNDSTLKFSSIIDRSWNPLYFQLDVVKEAHRENA